MIRLNSATNILLLVIYCLWCHLQPTAGVPFHCPDHSCPGKRTDIDDLIQTVDLKAGGEGSDIQKTKRRRKKRRRKRKRWISWG
jgi:hypothetical protein